MIWRTTSNATTLLGDDISVSSWITATQWEAHILINAPHLSPSERQMVATLAATDHAAAQIEAFNVAAEFRASLLGEADG